MPFLSSRASELAIWTSSAPSVPSPSLACSDDTFWSANGVRRLDGAAVTVPVLFGVALQ